MVEHTHPSLPTVVNLVSPEDWVTLSLDPDSCHRVVENLIFFQQTKTLNKERNQTTKTKVFFCLFVSDLRHNK